MGLNIQAHTDTDKHKTWRTADQSKCENIVQPAPAIREMLITAAPRFPTQRAVTKEGGERVMTDGNSHGALVGM